MTPSVAKANAAARRGSMALARKMVTVYACAAAGNAEEKQLGDAADLRKGAARPRRRWTKRSQSGDAGGPGRNRLRPV